MSMHDEHWIKMKAVWDACMAAHVMPPEAVHNYFGGKEPRDPPGKNKDVRLLPCPFCGSKAEIMQKEHSNSAPSFDVCCSDSHCYLAEGADYWFDSEAEATAIWNRRLTRANALSHAIECKL